MDPTGESNTEELKLGVLKENKKGSGEMNEESNTEELKSIFLIGSIGSFWDIGESNTEELK